MTLIERMGWTEKERSTSFDNKPIDGLFFLHGDVLDAFTKGQKYPMIAFPSGIECDLWETSDPSAIGIVHIFGEMDLALASSRDDAFETAQAIADACGYGVRKVGDTRIEVVGHDPAEHFSIEYDNATNRIVDVVHVKKEKHSKPFTPELLPEGIRAQLPPLYSQEQLGLEALAQVKFFTPDAQWSWFASEGSPVDEDGYYDTDKAKVDYLFFGLVAGFEVELGYFSLSELQEVRGPMGLPIERDRHFEPTTLQKLKDSYKRR